MSEVKRIKNIDEVIEASEMIARIDKQFDSRHFVVPGARKYIPSHFAAALSSDLALDQDSVAFMAEHAFIWGHLVIPPHNRRIKIATEHIFVTDWEKSVQDGGKVIEAFEKWAYDVGASSVYVTLQPAFDKRKERWMSRKGYRAHETIFEKIFDDKPTTEEPTIDAWNDVEETGKIENADT